MMRKEKKIPFNVFKKAVVAGFLGLTMFAGSAMLAGCTGEKGDKGDAGTNGATWYSGTQTPVNTQGNVGDFYFDTDDYNIYQKTASGWLIISNIKGRDAINPTFSVSIDGYWVINGNKTSYKATGDDGEDGNTPYISNGTWWIDGNNTTISANGLEGKSAYDIAVEEGFEGDESAWL